MFSKKSPLLKQCLKYFFLLFIAPLYFFENEECGALTWTENFSSTSRIESYDLSFNSALKQFRPFQRLEGWNSGAGTQNTAIDFGDGSHGSFEPSTFSQFGSVVGNTITINTNSIYPLLVTSFHLPLGWTLRGEGSNPLDIRSQSDIVVEGVINCDGENGQSINSVNTTVSLGGTAHCGKGTGGNGGTVGFQATNGTAGGTSVSGGRGANVANSAPSPNNVGATGGGGGGAYRQVGTPAEDGFDSGETPWTSAGHNFRDDAFSELGGGSGGGGGSAYSGTDTPNHASGGGGGAGGGVILLKAVRDIKVSGSLLARGGNGGGTTGTLRGGGGGGGGGGSIAVWAGRDLSFTGVISATNGVGGESGIDLADAPVGNFPDQGDGGDGSEGRTWITDKDKCVPGICTSTEIPITLLLDEGRVLSQLGTFTILSKTIDLQNREPRLQSASVRGVIGSGSTITLEMASGESSDFDPTGHWSPPSSLVGQRLGRYIKFKITVNNQDAVSPTVVEGIDIEYEGYQQNEFNFVSCGQVNHSSHVSTLPLFAILGWWMFFLLPLWVWFPLRHYLRSR